MMSFAKTQTSANNEKMFILQRYEKNNCLNNCSAQNNNWCFFTVLIFIINSYEIKTTEIEIFYFQPVHSFMSTDSFRQQVEPRKKCVKSMTFIIMENQSGMQMKVMMMFKS